MNHIKFFIFFKIDYFYYLFIFFIKSKMLLLSLLHFLVYILTAGSHGYLLLGYIITNLFTGTHSALIICTLNYCYLIACFPIWLYGIFNNRMIMGFDTRKILYLHYIFCVYYLFTYDERTLNYRTKFFKWNIIAWSILWVTSYDIYGNIIPYSIDIMDFTIPLMLIILVSLKIDSLSAK